jgi:hypothetical protein
MAEKSYLYVCIDWTVSMEYIIYSDESVSKGELFSDFFGGALVTNRNFTEVNKALEARKLELNLMGEIKWTKVSDYQDHPSGSGA